MKTAPRDIWLLGTAFLVLFCGYDGVQQYVTTYFDERGQAALGFQALVVLYVAFSLSGSISSVVVKRLGAKRSMIIAAPVYSLFMAAVLSACAVAVYVASVALGVAAALLWTAQGAYFVRASKRETLGANAGLFTTLSAVGPALGVVLTGIGISSFSYTATFSVAALLPLVAALVFGLLDNKSGGLGAQVGKRRAFRVFRSRTAWRFSGIWFASWMLLGLSVGTIPIQVTQAVGTGWSGALLALTFIAPIVISYPVGRLSDGKSRILVTALGLFAGFVSQLVLFAVTSAAGITLGVVAVSLSFAILSTVSMALLGDLAGHQYVDSLSAFSTTVKTVGMMTALIVADVLRNRNTYLVGAIILSGITISIVPVLRKGVAVTQDQLARELNDSPKVPAFRVD
jgi:MFS family permease